jgi:hypothetical protein
MLGIKKLVGDPFGEHAAGIGVGKEKHLILA